MTSISIGWDSRYKNCPLVAITWIFNTFTDLHWQLQGLWIPVLTSHVNDRDSAYFDGPLVAITGYLDILLTPSSNEREFKYFN